MIQLYLSLWQKKCTKINNLSGGQFSVNKNMFKTPMLRSDLCDYSDAYILLKRTVIVAGTNNAK